MFYVTGTSLTCKLKWNTGAGAILATLRQIPHVSLSSSLNRYFAPWTWTWWWQSFKPAPELWRRFSDYRHVQAESLRLLHLPFPAVSENNPQKASGSSVLPPAPQERDPRAPPLFPRTTAVGTAGSPQRSGRCSGMPQRRPTATNGGRNSDCFPRARTGGTALEGVPNLPRSLLGKAALPTNPFRLRACSKAHRAPAPPLHLAARPSAALTPGWLRHQPCVGCPSSGTGWTLRTMPVPEQTHSESRADDLPPLEANGSSHHMFRRRRSAGASRPPLPSGARAE